MASGYSFPTIGRGRIWRNDKNTMTLKCQAENVKEESCNGNTQNHSGITRDPWRSYQPTTGDLDEPLATDFMFEYDDKLNKEEEEEEEGSQQTTVTNVMNILSGTCNYLTNTDNLSTSICGEEAEQIFTSFAYSPFTSMSAKHQKQTEAVTTSTDYTKNKKPIGLFLKESSVKKLEEVSKCNKLPAPTYSLISRKQTVNSFVAVCEFLDYVATGYGNSQNGAREEAAVKMLQNLHIYDDYSLKYDDSFGHSFNYNFIQEKDQDSSQDDTQQECIAPFVQQSNLNLKEPGSGTQYSLPELAMRPTGNKQYVWLLQSIASKMNFEVRYEIVPHRTSSGLAQCMVHLCKDPPMVCYGSAKSENKAKYSAARCAFEYLKIVYQK